MSFQNQIGTWPTLVAGALACLGSLHAQTQSPVFKSGVRLLTVDVTVVDGAGVPIQNLVAEDFGAQVNGKTRPVQSLDFIQYGSPLSSDRQSTAGSAERRESGGAQTFLLLFDDDSFAPGNGKSLQASAERVIRQIDAGAMVGAATTSAAEPPLAPTRNREALHDYAKRLVGQNVDNAEPFFLTIPEAVGLRRTNGITGETVEIYRRECPIAEGNQQCPSSLRAAAERLFLKTQRRVAGQIRSIHDAIATMSALPAPRTIVLLSAGMALDVMPDARRALDSLRRTAASSGVFLYSLFDGGDQIDMRDSGFERAKSRRAEVIELTNGLQSVTAAAGGVSFRVIGTADRFFSRIVSETSAVYRLGIQVPLEDIDLAAARVTVEVRRPGATVRSTGLALDRDAVPVTPGIDPLQQRIQQGGAAYEVPFALATQIRLDKGATAQVLLDARIPNSVKLPARLMFALLDKTGSIISSGTKTLVANAASGDATVLLPIAIVPGEYRLRFVVADANNRIGSIERNVAATVRSLGVYAVSDLMTFYPDGRGRGYSAFDSTPLGAKSLNAVIEIYPQPGQTTAPSVRFSILTNDGLLVLSQGATTEFSTDRWTSSATVQLDLVPNGPFTLRAEIHQGNTVVGTQSRSVLKK